jgi:CheY-like chemotaxis protein
MAAPAEPKRSDIVVLIATDVRTDADVIRKLLGNEFGSVAVSADPDAAAGDFERHRPKVLLLAFDSLEKAQRYYLGLYRFSPVVHSVPHRTLILCNKEEVRAVYELCRKAFFDDYVLYWPLSHDGPRLLMSLHLAIRHLADGALPSATQLAMQARRMATLEALLKDAMVDIDARIAHSSIRLQEAETTAGAAIDAFSRDMAGGKFEAAVAVKDAAALAMELNRLKTNGLQEPLRLAFEATRPVQQWAESFEQRVGPHLEAVRTLQSMAEQVRPRVLVVDDDPFQLKLIAAALDGEGYDLDTASSGTGALKLAHNRRPDLVLLDMNMPEMGGIEVLRHLRALPQCSGIPVIMITGNSERQVVLDCLQAGATGFIVKPVDRAVLTKRLGEVLQVREG